MCNKSDSRNVLKKKFVDPLENWWKNVTANAMANDEDGRAAEERHDRT